MNIVKASDLKIDSTSVLRMLVYGDATCGKTTFAATAPKPILYFDFDNKSKPLYGIPDIDIVSYGFDSATDGAKQYRAFLADFKELRSGKALANGRTFADYKTVVFDSGTTLDKMMLLHCMVLAGKDPATKPTLPVYGDQKDQWEMFLMELKGMTKVNVIFLMHPMEIRDDSEEGSGELLGIVPLITGKKIQPKLPALFEEIYYLENRQDKRILHYKNWRKALASSLILKGSGELPDPTFASIYEAYQKQAKA